MIQLQTGEFNQFGQIFGIDKQREEEIVNEMASIMRGGLSDTIKEAAKTEDGYSSEDLIKALFPVAKTPEEQCYVCIQIGMKICEITESYKSPLHNILSGILGE